VLKLFAADASVVAGVFNGCFLKQPHPQKFGHDKEVLPE
jgi:hypothetical protein